MTLSPNKLMTYGALGFAAFSLWFISKKQGGGALSSQPGQQARDVGLQDFHDQVSQQYADINRQTAMAASDITQGAS